MRITCLILFASHEHFVTLCKMIIVTFFKKGELEICAFIPYLIAKNIPALVVLTTLFFMKKNMVDQDQRVRKGFFFTCHYAKRPYNCYAESFLSMCLRFYMSVFSILGILIFLWSFLSSWAVEYPTHCWCIFIAGWPCWLCVCFRRSGLQSCSLSSWMNQKSSVISGPSHTYGGCITTKVLWTFLRELLSVPSD